MRGGSAEHRQEWLCHRITEQERLSGWCARVMLVEEARCGGQARSGGTGRRAGLKIQWYLVPCGFDPLLRDQQPKVESRESRVEGSEPWAHGRLRCAAGPSLVGKRAANRVLREH